MLTCDNRTILTAALTSDLLEVHGDNINVSRVFVIHSLRTGCGRAHPP
jgi:hypothetical protein